MRKKEIYTADAHTDEALMDHIRSHADTLYHPVGTCKMGIDELAVVDPVNIKDQRKLRFVLMQLS